MGSRHDVCKATTWSSDDNPRQVCENIIDRIWRQFFKQVYRVKISQTFYSHDRREWKQMWRSSHARRSEGDAWGNVCVSHVRYTASAVCVTSVHFGSIKRMESACRRGHLSGFFLQLLVVISLMMCKKRVYKQKNRDTKINENCFLKFK